MRHMYSWKSSKSMHCWLDNHIIRTIEKNQLGHQRELATCESHYQSWIYHQCSIGWIVEGVQGYFCLDLQRFEGDTTQNSSTLNWIEYINTTCSSSKVLIN
jgi:hypothetical protein